MCLARHRMYTESVWQNTSSWSSELRSLPYKRDRPPVVVTGLHVDFSPLCECPLPSHHSSLYQRLSQTDQIVEYWLRTSNNSTPLCECPLPLSQTDQIFVVCACESKDLCSSIDRNHKSNSLCFGLSEISASNRQ